MKQSTPRRSATKQAAVARRLNATAAIAPHVLNSTIYHESSEQVQLVQAGNAARIGNLDITEGQHLYKVASKFANRFYLVSQDGKCSATDERASAACIAKVQAFRLTSAA